MAYGCAPALQPDPTSARNLVAEAYASGASRLAVDEYRMAAMSLRNAEQQIRTKDNDLAYESLRLARKYALDALQLAEKEKQLRLENSRGFQSRFRISNIHAHSAKLQQLPKYLEDN